MGITSVLQTVPDAPKVNLLEVMQQHTVEQHCPPLNPLKGVFFLNFYAFHPKSVFKFAALPSLLLLLSISYPRPLHHPTGQSDASQISRFPVKQGSNLEMFKPVLKCVNTNELLLPKRLHF